MPFTIVSIETCINVQYAGTHAYVQVNILPVFTFLYTRMDLHVRVLFSKPVAMVSNSQSLAD